MVHVFDVTYRGRELQIEASVVGGDWQIWFYERGRRVYLHSVLPHERMHEVQDALMQARRELESDAIVVPVVRMSPPRPEANVDAAPRE